MVIFHSYVSLPEGRWRKEAVEKTNPKAGPLMRENPRSASSAPARCEFVAGWSLGSWRLWPMWLSESQTKSPSWTKMLRRSPLEATIQKVTSLLNVGGVVHDYLPRFTGMVLETDGMSHRGLLGGWCLWCWPRIQRNTVHWSGNSMWKATYHHLVVTLWQNSSTRV